MLFQYVPDPIEGGLDDTISKLLWKTWARFARGGKPHPAWQPLSEKNMTSWTHGFKGTLENGNPEWRFKTGPLADEKRMKFWDRIEEDSNNKEVDISFTDSISRRIIAKAENPSRGRKSER